MLGQARMAARFARDLRGFLHDRYTLDECRQHLASQLARRDASFLELVERGVFGNPRSPYRVLLQDARIAHGDIARWVRQAGVEGALTRLYEAGIFVTLDEFKGRVPIHRGRVELSVSDRDFDNPLLVS